MMIKKLCIEVLLILFCFQGLPSVIYADSAGVLPKGRFSFNSSGKYYFELEHRYSGDGGSRGDVEDIATDFNAVLDGRFLGTATTENVGNSIVDFQLQYSTLEFSFLYGITDKLSAGVIVPYWWSRNKVKAAIDTSNATLGKTVTGTGFGVPIAPFGTFGDEVPLDIEDLQDILGGGLDVDGNGTVDVPGNGYKRFKSWSGEGIGDIQAGFKYQYLKTKNWRLAFTGGSFFPTGEEDDADNLVDFRPFGSGTFIPFLYSHNDFTGIENHVINGTVRYNLSLQDDNVELRIGTDVNRPLGTKERVRRDWGDIVEIEVSDTYTPLKGFNVSALYNFEFQYKNDRVSGDAGLNYASEEKETAFKSHNILLNLSYSTIPLFMEKKFPIPLDGYVEYRYKFAGRNNSLKSQYISFGLSLYF